MDASGAYVDTVNLTTQGDTSGSHAEVAFTNSTGPVLSSYFSCANGATVGSSPVTATTYACTIGTGSGGYAMSTFQSISVVVK